ncbi:broad-complex core protein-like, partial [Teleopsis dalmanni]
SPYFQSILQDVPMDHCSIIFPGVKAFEMRALLEYMYTGEVNVTQSQIPKIMKIAGDLEVKGLFDMADLREKFKSNNTDHHERIGNPFVNSAGITIPPYTAAAVATASSTADAENGKNHVDIQNAHNSSSVISTSSNISPSAAPTSSSSPPYNNFKPTYPTLYGKATTPPTTAASATPQPISNVNLPQTSPAYAHQQSNPSERVSGAWPISPNSAAAMLSSVYESAPDMNPLKRKKLSSISSMLMNRDTPILRNVLAQANPADSSQPLPLMLPGGVKNENSVIEKTSQHSATVRPQSSNHSVNGSDYSSDKKYNDEPHSPYTDHSFEEDGFTPKRNFSGSFNSNGNNQKPEWKRYKQYTRNDIMSAIQCVRNGMSALQASRKFNVPSRTLYDKVKKLGITTGRPMNRTMKRSPSSMEASAAFPYAQGFGHAEPILSSMHEGVHEERDTKEQRISERHHLPNTISHSAASLLDHPFIQQALENRGADIGGRGALHAMAFAAAAHAAVNRIPTSPSSNSGRRTPSPSHYSIKYDHESERELLLEREREKERRLVLERDIDIERECEIERNLEREREREQEREDLHHDEIDEDHDPEDLSIARKQDCKSPDLQRHASTPHSPSYAENGSGVIMHPMHAKVNSEEFASENAAKLMRDEENNTD